MNQRCDANASGLWVRVENVGGIDESEHRFEAGVTLLVGQNATNRTSLLQALALGLGGSARPLKTDADSGRVELDVDGDRVERVLARRRGRVTVEGDPYVEDSMLVDRFVRLLADNPARRSVERGDRLREVVMGPVDTGAIERQIREREAELDDVRAEIETLERKRDRLPDLRAREERLRSELDSVTSDLEEARRAVESFEADPEEAEAAERLVDRVETARQRRDRLENAIETQESSIDALRTERAEVEAELSDLAVEEDRIAELESELARLTERKRALSDAVADLSTIVEFNEDLLDGGLPDPVRPETEAPTARLLDDGGVECWTCGSRVERSAIRDRVEQFRDLVADRRSEVADLDDRIDELRDERSQLASDRRRRAAFEDKLDRIETEIEDPRETLADHREELSAVETRIDELDAEIADAEALQNTELLDRYERVSDLEYERGKVETELDDVRDDIEAIEATSRRSRTSGSGANGSARR